jgi:hypothetical protein
MRLTGIELDYQEPVDVPAIAQKAVAIIGNPLTFKFETLSPSQAMELGQWWSALNVGERRRFASFYGLWVAGTPR